MKKTLIALVVAASAISEVAMADSGTFQFGGILLPEAKIHNSWKVKIESGVNDLSTEVKENTTDVSIPVLNPIPLLGIHTLGNEPIPDTTAKGIHAGVGMTPIIHYGANIDLDRGFHNSVVPVTLELQDNNGKKIGKLTAHMFAYGEMIAKGSGYTKNITARTRLVAPEEDDLFFGGLPIVAGSAMDEANGLARISKLDPFVLEQYDQNIQQNTLSWDVSEESTLQDYPDFTFNAIYCSGFEQGSTIDLKLDSPMSHDESLSWKATLPVTVSYM